MDMVDVSCTLDFFDDQAGNRLQRPPRLESTARAMAPGYRFRTRARNRVLAWTWTAPLKLNQCDKFNFHLAPI
jgi:hypothetical protein